MSSTPFTKPVDPPTAKPLDTDFMKKFIAEFIDNTADPWPKPGTARDKIAEELVTIISPLVNGAVRMPAISAVSGTSNALEARVRNFLANYTAPAATSPFGGWPLGHDVDAVCKGPPKTSKRAVRLGEVCAIFHRLSNAVSVLLGPGDGGGGESTSIPPH